MAKIFWRIELINKRCDTMNIFEEFQNRIKPELFSYSEGMHGLNHTRRVLYFASIISDCYQLTDHECIIIALAACYHDIGRTNNGLEMIHGHMSAQKIQVLGLLDSEGLTGLEKQSVLKIVESHNEPDEEFPTISERERFMFYVVKDADALDRVRFHGNYFMRLRFGIDVSQLRLPVSKEIVK